MNASGWIKLEPGSWPDNGQRILAVIDTGITGKWMELGEFSRLGHGRFEFSPNDADSMPTSSVLYWQPLPDPPEDCR